MQAFQLDSEQHVLTAMNFRQQLSARLMRCVFFDEARKLRNFTMPTVNTVRACDTVTN